MNQDEKERPMIRQKTLQLAAFSSNNQGCLNYGGTAWEDEEGDVNDSR